MSNGLVAALDGLKKRKASGTQVPEALGSQEPSKRSIPGKAKSRNPEEFETAKVYVRRTTKKAAWRKYQDAGGLELSELVEMLLQQYVSS